MLDLDEKLLDYIDRQTELTGFPPSVRDIQIALDIKSTSTVHTHLRRLQQQGKLIKIDGKRRALRVAHHERPEPGTVSSDVIPFLVRVTEGVPLLSPVNCSGSIAFPTPDKSVDFSTLFCLRIHGDDMKNAGLIDEDIVIVQTGGEYVNGSVVSVLINGAPVVKRFYKENGVVLFQSDNGVRPTIGNESMILGKVITSVRYY